MLDDLPGGLGERWLGRSRTRLARDVTLWVAIAVVMDESAFSTRKLAARYPGSNRPLSETTSRSACDRRPAGRREAIRLRDAAAGALETFVE